MATGAHDRITSVVDGINRLQGSFAWERKIFLGGIALGILLMAFFSIMTAFGYIDKDDWIVVFGPSGAFTGMCTVAMTYFNKSLQIVGRMAEGSDGN